jgi:hypothetical protein
MSDVETYQSAVQACAIAATLLRQHDIPELLRAIEHADAFGPLLDPTLWRDKHEAMNRDRKLLEAALPLWRLAASQAAGKEPSRG